jgi:hypothetical protein
MVLSEGVMHLLGPKLPETTRQRPSGPEEYTGNAMAVVAQQPSQIPIVSRSPQWTDVDDVVEM